MPVHGVCRGIKALLASQARWVATALLASAVLQASRAIPARAVDAAGRRRPPMNQQL